MKRRPSRRQLLRGAVAGVGAAVGLPLLEAMLNGNGDALADGSALPVRFGIFYWGNGVRLKYWVPAETGPGWQLTPLLMPFAKVKKYISIVSGTGVYTPIKVAGHMSSLQGVLSGAPGIPQGGLNYAYSGPTMDVAIAAKIGTTTRFKSLEMGVASTDASDADFGSVGKALSHNGPNSPNLPVFDPIALYDRVFGDGFSTGKATAVANVTLNVRKSVLDVVAADVKTLQARLGATDRQRLDQHLQGVLDLEKQLANVPATAAGCARPTRPSSSYAPMNGLIQWEPLAAAMRELLAFVLACDQTRVFSFRLSPCNDFTVYPGFPAFTIDPKTTDTGTSMHAFTHYEDGDQPNVQKCVTFSMTQFALLLERLMATPDGTGSLLDNVAIFGFTECDEGHTHNYRQTSTPGSGIPIIVAGGGGGKLVTPGIHYRSPRQGDLPAENAGRNVSVVPLTLMQALGTGITSWGAGPGMATTVIRELLA